MESSLGKFRRVFVANCFAGISWVYGVAAKIYSETDLNAHTPNLFFRQGSGEKIISIFTAKNLGHFILV